MLERIWGSPGGKAEASGAAYETLVGAWYCGRILVGQSGQPLFDLPASTTLLSLACQTAESIDDLNVRTSEGGVIFIQVKRSVVLGDGQESAFAKAIDQFVRQQKNGRMPPRPAEDAA